MNFPKFILYTTAPLPFDLCDREQGMGADDDFSSHETDPLILNEGRSDGRPVSRELLSFFGAPQATERIGLDILKEHPCYRIAIRALDRPVCCFSTSNSLLKSFFWRSLTLPGKSENSQMTVLVNINSAAKRLRPLGFSRRQVISALERGDFLRMIFVKYLETYISRNRLNLQSSKTTIIQTLIEWLDDGVIAEGEVEAILYDLERREHAAGWLQSMKWEILRKKIPGHADDITWLCIEKIKNKNPSSSYQNVIVKFLDDRREYKEKISIHFFGDAPPLLEVIDYKINADKINFSAEVIDHFKITALTSAIKEAGLSLDPSSICDEVEVIRMIVKRSFLKIVEAIRDYSKTEEISFKQALLPYHYGLIIDCQGKEKLKVVRRLIQRNISVESIRKILNVVHEFQTTVWKGYFNYRKPIKVDKAQVKNGRLPYSLQYNSLDRSIYILTNTILGEGSFKEVKLAISMITGRAYAQTICKFENQERKTKASKMFSDLCQLEGYDGVPFVLQESYMEIFSDLRQESKGEISYMTEYYDGGNLHKWIFSPMIHTMQMEKDRILIAVSLFKHLAWLHHEKGIMHLDIKPENIVYRRNRGENNEIEKIAIIDFDFACARANREKRRDKMGTTHYLSPEKASAMISNHLEEIIASNDFPADIWAAGLILYFLFKSEVPAWRNFSTFPLHFSSEKRSVKLAHLKGLPRNWLPEDPSSIAVLIRKLLAINPEERPTAREAFDELQQIFTNPLSGV